MRAARLHEYGPPERLVVEEVPDPTLERPTDVLVDVHAAAINPIDWKIRAGAQRGAIRLSLPWTLGMDFAGVVAEVGSGVTRVQVGDRVYGCQDHRRPGTYAERIAVAEGHLAAMPPALTFVEAASLPLVGMTSWQCLMPALTQQSRRRVFIQAGSGGVGTFAIQLARHHGAWVATTCSPRNHELVESLGADEVIDYRTRNWWEELSELDLVLDALGGTERDRALAATRRGGRVASIVSGLPGNTTRYGPNLGVLATGAGIAGFRLRGLLAGIDAATVLMRTRADELEAIAALVEGGAIRPVVDRTFPLDQVAEAHAYGETGRIRGKVVVETRPS